MDFVPVSLSHGSDFADQINAETIALDFTFTIYVSSNMLRANFPDLGISAAAQMLPNVARFKGLIPDILNNVEVNIPAQNDLLSFGCEGHQVRALDSCRFRDQQ